jgi:hypothetical protein
MLIGRISRHDFGTRISGRAGSDLNGLAELVLYQLIFAGFTVQMIARGNYGTGELAWFAGLLLLSLLVFWFSHKQRREAEPLVRFLRNAVEQPGRSAGARVKGVRFTKAMRIDAGGRELEEPATAEAVHEALLRVGEGDFLILSEGPETFMQTALQDGSFVIEIREGDHLNHYRAVRTDNPAVEDTARGAFTFEEVLEAFLAYGTDGPTPGFLKWEKMSLPE